jgi:DNA-binding transcriptional LysR family regulator
MNITLRQLQIFSVVARLGSVSGAAAELHLTPPAVSMQLRELESQVGLTLFDREGRRLSLSTAGEYFVVHAKRMLANLRDAESAMARFRKLEVGLLTIGMVSTAEYFVPHLLAQFRKERPGVDVKLQVMGNREALVASLDGNQLDLAIMGRPPVEVATRAEVFAPHPMGFVAAPDHPLLALDELPARLLESHPLIAREPGSGTRTAMHKYLQEHQVEPHITMEMSSNEAIKQAVMAGMGASFLSWHTVALEVRNGLLCLLNVEGTPVVRTWNVVHLQSRVLSPPAEAFRYFIIERAQAHLAAMDAQTVRGYAA